MANIGQRMQVPTKVTVSFAGAGRVDAGTWVDILLPKVRRLRDYLADTEVVAQVVSQGEYTPEQVWLCLGACKVLDA